MCLVINSVDVWNISILARFGVLVTVEESIIWSDYSLIFNSGNAGMKS